ncbi:PaaI family thioesterase [Sandaracinus amylolyticus]|uniref:Thioesterase domain-containing protein n=1 Tax=Sandaracinus amylolyticus TaxID=927083 RepID=A0A0F6SE82_9BACT|nr:PaaI family thioesterase [Sandaracinus amylolyticus]AKF04739.1 hypothetical protein DB32_001888 [Sandaracinus amylolyticus]
MTPAALEGLLQRAREARDPSVLVAAIPYAQFLGLGLEPDGDGVRGRLRYDESLIGDATIPALHGGTIAALLESTAILDVLWRAEDEIVLPRTITFTIDYLRSGRPVDTLCRASIVRQGKRVVVVDVRAFQDDDESRPIATAVVHLLVARDTSDAD